VLEQGRITQDGTHEQLINEPGLYRRLWEIQGALEEDLKSELVSVGQGQWLTNNSRTTRTTTRA